MAALAIAGDEKCRTGQVILENVLFTWQYAKEDEIDLGIIQVIHNLDKCTF